MISGPDRRKACELIEEATQAGARRERICAQHSSVAAFVRAGAAEFATIPSDAVMERCPGSRFPIRMAPLHAGWSDLGAWNAVCSVLPEDPHGNARRRTDSRQNPLSGCGAQNTKNTPCTARSTAPGFGTTASTVAGASRSSASKSSWVPAAACKTTTVPSTGWSSRARQKSPSVTKNCYSPKISPPTSPWARCTASPTPDTIPLEIIEVQSGS